MKQRLPDMGPAAVDQSDSGATRLAETFAQPGREFEPAGASADDDDMMQRGIRHAGFTQSREAYRGDRPLAESKQEMRPRRRGPEVGQFGAKVAYKSCMGASTFVADATLRT